MKARTEGRDALAFESDLEKLIFFEKELQMNIEKEMDKYLSEDVRRKIAEDAYRQIMVAEIERRFSNQSIYDVVRNIADAVVSSKLKEVLGDEKTGKIIYDRVMNVIGNLSEFQVFAYSNGASVIDKAVSENCELVKERVTQILKDDMTLAELRVKVHERLDEIVNEVIRRFPFFGSDNQ